METVILLLVLFLSDKNANVQETLRSFLKFYRENRELVAMLTQKTAPAQTASAAAPQNADGETGAEKNPPQDAAGALNVLEEFLKNQSV